MIQEQGISIKSTSDREIEEYLQQQIKESDIAIIGIAGRFPGANNIDEFWQNLRDGVESISFLSDEELLDKGVEPSLLNNQDYVKAALILPDVEKFDASFFGYSLIQAEITDPQQRIFLECAWSALENAGYQPGRQYSIGVYGGEILSTYLLNNVNNNNGFYAGRLIDSKQAIDLLTGGSQASLVPIVAYKLDLKGPAINLPTYCSTSLVAVHIACQSLLNDECDLALAGGVSVIVPHNIGYLYRKGLMQSSDGHCRAFDRDATGTHFGDGVGIVVLKKLERAVADGDCIYAVIKGSAINNDGRSDKNSFYAPSINGQAAVITAAQKVSGINPETINYIEAHGTATPTGDPIEVAALTQAFRSKTNKKGFCAIGSVKTNVGHLAAASGIAGLIKTVLALKHKQIPPSLNFKTPNPKIDFKNSPFFVNAKLAEWQKNGTPRRAGVSSFGFGGTNAHVILEEWEPEERQKAEGNRQQVKQLLMLSAKTATALETATVNLANHLKSHPELNLADVAYTLTVGRKAFNHRRIAVVSNLEDPANTLLDSKQILSNSGEVKTRSVALMFSGQGSQYVNMARELYETQAYFQEQVDKCCTFLQPHLGLDLREILYPTENQTKTATEKLKETSITQPALFVIEYALAQLWMSWGIKPAALIGHSIGEYVAATLAGVFSLEDALALVTARGKLMQSMPTGSMLAVPLPEEEVKPLLEGTTLEIATVNSPTNCVVSGTTEGIEALLKELATKEIECRNLQTSHAFHSRMMEPILEPFTNKVKQVKLNPPTIPFVSNVTGTWITVEQATNPNYYAQHLRSCVRFADGVKQLFANPEQILLEVGPGRTLSTLVKRHPDKPKEQITLTSVRHPQEQESDVTFLLKALGQLWLAGSEVDWDSYYGKEKHYRVPLPTYPFERKRYWIDPPKQQAKVPEILDEKKPDIADWFYEPSWKRLSLPSNHRQAIQSPVLVFVDESSLGAELIKQLESKTSEIIKVKVGEKFAKPDSNFYSINPNNPSDYQSLIQTLQVQKLTPQTIVHLWNVTENKGTELTRESIEATQNLGFYSLLYLSQALGQQNLDSEIEMVVVSNELQNVTGEEIICPEKATLIGVVRVIPQEFSQFHCRSVDIVLPLSGSQGEEKVIAQILKELERKSEDKIIAYRGNSRWVETFEPVRLEKPSQEKLPFKQGGVYLITGGLGGIGLVFAEHLAKTRQAKLILIGRSALPERSAWEQWLTDHREEDPTSQKMRKVQDLEALGAEVLVLRADVAQREQMAEAISLAQKQFGQINGVIHSAGIINREAFVEIGQMSKSTCEKHFGSKVLGTAILSELLPKKNLDFCLLMSSISSILGGLGYVAYSAANKFMDAWVQKQNKNSFFPWLSINWDAWKVGLSGENVKNTSMDGLSILPQEGVDALTRLLSNKEFNQTVVSTGDLQGRINKWVKLQAIEIEDKKEKSERPELSQAYEAPQSPIEKTTAQVWEQVLGIENIGVNDNLFELGGDSITAIILVNKLQKELDCFLNVSALLEAPTIKQFATYFGENYLKSVQKTELPTEKLNSEQIAWLRQYLLHLHSGNSVRSDKSGQKNKPAIFILCPPRSGSTLLRVILGGHPQLFAPPELHLLSFNTLAERKAVFSEGNKFFLEGLIRAIMAIKNCDGERAKQIMEELEEQNLSTKQFFSLMQEWLPGKIIADKTPTYAFNPQVLQRAEAEFENPLYIHLLRHPLAMIRSMEQIRLDLLLAMTGDSDEMRFSVKQKGELMWSIAHNNILEFLKNVPSSRQHRLKYEDLVQQPQSTVNQLCEFMGVDFHADMLQPYQEKKQRMTDGIHSVSLMIGDPKFHTHKSIDAEAADRWKEDYQVDFLAEETWQVAEELGYARMTVTDNNREEGEI